MIYVEVNFTVAPADKDAALQCLLDELPLMRNLVGNLGCKVLTDPQSEGAVTLLHRWNKLEDLDAYRSGPLMAKVGSILRPMMIAAPSTIVYQGHPLD
jgi:quinol monooxygenase YgiN